MKSAELKIVRFDERDVIATSNWSDTYVALNKYSVSVGYANWGEPIPGTNYYNILDGEPSYDSNGNILEKDKSYRFDYDSLTGYGYYRWQTVSQ